EWAGVIRVRDHWQKFAVEHARPVARPACSGDAWRAVLAQAGALFKRNRRVRRGQLARVESLRSHASAWHTMVGRSSKCGCHLSKERARSEAAALWRRR